MKNLGVCVCVFFHLSFLNFCAVNVESAKETNSLESSPVPIGFIIEKDQYHDISETSDSARGSSCLNQVMSLTALCF